MKSKILFFFFLVLSGVLNGQNKQQDSVYLSIEEAWEKANTYSKELRLKHYDTKIGEKEVMNSKKQWLPHVAIDGSYGRLANVPVFKDGLLEKPEYIPIEDHTIYDAGIEAYLNLYSGHKTQVHIKEAEEKEVLLQYLEEKSISDIHYRVAMEYLDMQRALELKKLIVQNIYRNNKRLDQISQLYENGVVLKSDLLRAKLQLSRQETNLLKMKNNVELATQQLNILIGYDDEQPIKPTDSIDIDLIKAEKAYLEYIDDAVRLSPSEKIAQSKIAITEFKLQELKSDKLPRLGLFGEYTYSYPQIKLYPYSTAPYLLGMAGLRFSYNLSALYHDKHKEEAAEIAIEQTKLAKEHTEDQLRTQVKAAYKHFHEDLEEVKVAKMNIIQAEENYRIVNQMYFNQLSLLTDLLDADTQLLQAKFDLINSKISARLHYYQLLKITGQL
ncbi:TolC family protein [Fulvivirga sediminis]|uniref:TolC family protein n=1 Tax=Fulvivirga sediminis TaxID=2803949 RepID=A0A937F6D7_9BACT|nr:TolC family protein [Fulvivirga sediminis]MBL3655861.1 TolC family protein [Fulvivirga sediminis]